MKMILFNQNPMIAKLLESVSKKLELSIENFNHYQELSAHLKKDPEWLLIADDECLEKLDQVDWLELKEIISQNKNSVCMYKKGNEAQPFLEGFEMKIKKPFLPTEMLKVLQKKLGSNASELEPSQNLDPTQEVLETNWDELENLGDLEALVQEEPNNEEQLLPTLNVQEEKEEVKQEEKETPQKEKEEVKETPQEEKKPKDDETQEGETPKDEEVSKELETQEELEIPKEETQEEVKEEIKEEVQEEVKEETQEIKEEKQEETQDSPSAQELEAMQELVKEIQENSNENKKETQESAEIPQDKEIQEVVTEKTQVQELEVPKEKVQESAEALQETQAQELEKEENSETPQDVEVPQSQEKETPQEETQEKETPQTQDEKPQEDHYESIEDIPEPVMAKAMGEELPFLNEAVAKTPNSENATETPKESDIKTPQEKEESTETPQEKEESDKTSSPLELRLNLQDLLKSLNQESLKSLLENKTLSIKITLEDKKPNA
ncbi:chemotaxis regulatory protein ChePep [Helicobacter pylori]|uniref:chemotaxis regulatory protein ChePep n=1 Tax=Helicobacter pylori TaxID=210 RepID=UPI002711E994|nr:chemotaxis regulatory protein ChePep [Helicobacter pylori]MDO7820690.1 chemotaxis regulatory protein ChePep [Helicobacter pylori]MDO7822401.1 chemotaxis regulatory protein ChePep [Helicobacter pylori]